MNFKIPRTHVSAAGGLQTATAVLSGDDTGERYAFLIQNQDTNVLKVKFGASASNTDFHYVLKACSVAADGTGGELAVSNYAGPLSVYSAGTPSYTIAPFVE